LIQRTNDNWKTRQAALAVADVADGSMHCRPPRVDSSARET